MTIAETLGWIVVFLIVLVASSSLSLVALIIILSQVFTIRKSVADTNAWLAEILDVVRWMSGLDSSQTPMLVIDSADSTSSSDQQSVNRAPNLHPDVAESSPGRHSTHRR